jgi:hypothetical protein
MGEQQACSPNNTCGAGLICRDALCVNATDSGGESDVGSVQAAGDGPSSDTAGVSLDGALREVPLLDAKIDALWITFNDCATYPMSCTTGGNEPSRTFDGTPYCTKGTTAARAKGDFGSGMTLGFLGAAAGGSFDAAGAGIVGLAFDITGQSPPLLNVDVQSQSLTPKVLALGTFGKAPLGQRSVVLFDHLTTYAGSTPVDPATLSALAVVVLVQPVPVAFDYCVANVAVIKR